MYKLDFRLSHLLLDVLNHSAILPCRRKETRLYSWHVSNSRFYNKQPQILSSSHNSLSPVRCNSMQLFTWCPSIQWFRDPGSSILCLHDSPGLWSPQMELSWRGRKPPTLGFMARPEVAPLISSTTWWCSVTQPGLIAREARKCHLARPPGQALILVSTISAIQGKTQIIHPSATK